MKNTPPFRFKQFTVHQTRAAMKVGFDGILLGAWTALAGSKRILDVGTGTGLVALMLAQRSQPGTAIDAIDIDQAAVEEAAANFQASPWKDELSVEHVSLDDYAVQTKSQYDLVVCNPPYFPGSKRDLKQVSSRARARNSLSLSLATLFSASMRLLSDDGNISVIVPADLEQICRAEAAAVGLGGLRTLRVRPLPTRPVHRTLMQFGRVPEQGQIVQELTMEHEHHVYTEAFRQLTREFYLAF